MSSGETDVGTFVALQRQLAAVRRALKRSYKGVKPFDEQVKNLGSMLAEMQNALGGKTDSIMRSLEQLTRDASSLSDDCEDFERELNKIQNEIEEKKKGVEKCFSLQDRQPEASSTSKRNGKEIAEEEEQSPEWREFEPKLEEKILDSCAMAHLKASYDTLETQLKFCLLCLAVFPEGEEIKKRVLIHWWIGEGLVTPKGDKPAEEVGEECFAKLLGLGLINNVGARSGSQSVHRFEVNPWIRRMLLHVAKEAKFFDFDLQGRPTTSSTTSRRACLVRQPKQGYSVAGISKLEELISLFNVNEQYITLKGDWLSRLEKVVVLQLGRWQIIPTHHIEVDDYKVLIGLGSLKHLRYLSLRGVSRVMELPESIKQLGNLRILDLRACHNLEKLPTGITSLKRLTHLDVTECYLLDHMPHGLSSLSELQVLKGFVLGSSSSKDACKLAELSKLEKLRELSINIGSDAQIDGDIDDLEKIKSLRSLTITWADVLPLPKKSSPGMLTKLLTRLKSTTAETTEPVPDPPTRESPSTEKQTKTTQTRLVPLPNLTKLDLRCILDDGTPSWLKPANFVNLKCLCIRGGRLCDLRFGEKWEKLEVLRLKFLQMLKLDWPKLQEDLPGLCFLQIFKCPNVSRAPKLDGDGIWVKTNEVEVVNPNQTVDKASSSLQTITEEASSSNQTTVEKASSSNPPGC